jgi:hypothetical protein
MTASAPGSKIAEALVLERQIGQQQMMIDDDDVGGLGVAPRLEHMAARELRAFLAETILARRGDSATPGLLRQIGEFGEIAVLVVAAQRETRASTRAMPRYPSKRALLSGKFQPMPA